MHIDLEKVYFQHKDSLLKFIYTLTKNQDDTEDILHETFSKLVLLNRDDKIDGRNIKSFIFKIAYNLFVDLYRRNKKSITLAENYLETVIQKEVEPNNQIDPFMFKKIVINTIEILEVKDRVKDVLKLRIQLHLDIEEISVIFQTSKRTIYRDFELGISELRKKIIHSGFDIEDLYEKE